MRKQPSSLAPISYILTYNLSFNSKYLFNILSEYIIRQRERERGKDKEIIFFTQRNYINNGEVLV